MRGCFGASGASEGGDHAEVEPASVRVREPATPDLTKDHRAISLHFKHFSESPDYVWQNNERKWHPLAELDTKILIFEDLARNWFLDLARRLLYPDGSAGFLVLLVATSYIEALQQLFAGQSSKKGSETCFKDGAKRILGMDDEQGTVLYTSVRCGLMHNGITKKGAAVDHDLPTTFEFRDSLLTVNPRKVLDAVVVELDRYIQRLLIERDGALRAKFEKYHTR